MFICSVALKPGLGSVFSIYCVTTTVRIAAEDYGGFVQLHVCVLLKPSTL
jgi:hypothetical protein